MTKGRGKSKGACKSGPPPRNMSWKDDRDKWQFYGRIVKLWGHGVVQVVYYGRSAKQEEEKLREIKAQVRQRRGLNKLKPMLDGYVIISLRDFQEDMSDVIHIYRPDETNKLVKKGVLPKGVDSNEYDGIDFVEMTEENGGMNVDVVESELNEIYEEDEDEDDEDDEDDEEDSN